MLQRIQTVWLLLAAFCVFLTMKASTYVGASADAVMHILKGTDNMLLVIITSMVGVVTLISIFLFGNRKLQLRIVLVALFLEMILMFLYYKEVAKLLNGALSITALLHVGVFVFLLLAAKGITADAKLIKDSSRLR